MGRRISGFERSREQPREKQATKRRQLEDRSLQCTVRRTEGQPWWRQAEAQMAARPGLWKHRVKGRPEGGPAAVSGKQAGRREQPGRAHLRVGALLRVAAAQDGARLVLQLLVFLEHVHQRHHGLQLRLAPGRALGSGHPQLSPGSAAWPRRRREKWPPGASREGGAPREGGAQAPDSQS